MTYFKIEDTDFSNVASGLAVKYVHKYKAKENVLGNTKIDYINRKRQVTVTLIPMSQEQMNAILNAIDAFTVKIWIKSPKTNALIYIDVKVADYEVAYYTIQNNNVSFKGFTLTFTEL